MPTVTRFNVTPVKATRLHHPRTIVFEPHGVPGNRDLFFVDERGHLFAGSKLGTLVQIEASFDAGADRLWFRFPDGIEVAGSAAPDGEEVDVDYFGRTVPSRIVEGPWTEHLSRFAGRELRVARVLAPGDGNDVHPVTFVSIASVEELARQGGGTPGLDPRRFRMTFEMDGVGPHEEDTWAGRRIRVGDAVLLVEEQVPRCVVTTQDPRTGLRDFPTLTVVRRYRGATEDGGLPFGMYASVLERGSASVGDPVELLP